MFARMVEYVCQDGRICLLGWLNMDGQACFQNLKLKVLDSSMCEMSVFTMLDGLMCIRLSVEFELINTCTTSM